LLAQLISNHLPIVKNQTGFVLFLKQYLTVIGPILEKNNFKGIRIAIKGRFGGISRTKKRVVQVGQVSLQSIQNNLVSYSITRSYTKYGVFSVKVWVCKNLN